MMTNKRLCYNILALVVGAASVFGTACALGASPATTDTQEQHYRTIATAAVDDLLGHFWQGDAASGQIVNTWYGYPATATTPLPDARGGLWERATFFFVLDNLYQATGDPTIKQRLAADWARTKKVYTAFQLEVCGQNSGVNWCVDDAGWSARMYLAAYRASGDSAALDHAKGLVAHAFDRWLDDQLGGGMWYRDAKDIKSLYQVAITLDALEIYEATSDQSFYDRALKCYNWMETYLLRDDGLYWCDYNATGPVGKDRPNDIKEAGSVSFLGGNMAMGVLHARFYRLTGKDEYRLRAIRTANTLPVKQVSAWGTYIDDRDAWANGTFVGDWAREVLTLPDMPLSHWDTLKKTADGIYTRDRTDDGYYGGCWYGPITDTAIWTRLGSKPQQIMTSSNAVNMIAGAANLEILSPAPKNNADREWALHPDL